MMTYIPRDVRFTTLQLSPIYQLLMLRTTIITVQYLLVQIELIYLDIRPISLSILPKAKCHPHEKYDERLIIIYCLLR